MMHISKKNILCFNITLGLGLQPLREFPYKFHTRSFFFQFILMLEILLFMVKIEKILDQNLLKIKVCAPICRYVIGPPLEFTLNYIGKRSNSTVFAGRALYASQTENQRTHICRCTLFSQKELKTTRSYDCAVYTDFVLFRTTSFHSNT